MISRVSYKTLGCSKSKPGDLFNFNFASLLTISSTVISNQSMWAEWSGRKSRSTLQQSSLIQCNLCSPLRDPPLRAPLRSIVFLQRLLTAPLHPIFGSLRSVFRSAHTCSCVDCGPVLDSRWKLFRIIIVFDKLNISNNLSLYILHGAYSFGDLIFFHWSGSWPLTRPCFELIFYFAHHWFIR